MSKAAHGKPYHCGRCNTGGTRFVGCALDEWCEAVPLESPAPTPIEAAREAVLSDLCPECGHSVGWHGENHDDGCNATGSCVCGLNARDCHAKIDKTAALDAYAAAIRASTLDEVRQKVEGLASIHYANVLGQHLHTVLLRDDVLRALSGEP